MFLASPETRRQGASKNYIHQKVPLASHTSQRPSAPSTASVTLPKTCWLFLPSSIRPGLVIFNPPGPTGPLLPSGDRKYFWLCSLPLAHHAWVLESYKFLPGGRTFPWCGDMPAPRNGQNVKDSSPQEGKGR